MPKIVVKKKAEVYTEYPIKPFQSKITIGSEGDNDLIITDKKVSFHHVMIEKDGTNFYIIDRGSAFGTVLNGEKIEERTALESGDEIRLGEHVLVFENILFRKSHEKDEQVEKSVNPEANSSEKDEKGGLPIAADETRKSEKRDDGKVKHCLVAIYGPYTGKKYRLNQGMTRIGRDSTLNDIVIRRNKNGDVDHSVSRRHATIICEDGDYYIFDKRSKTRTSVNGQIINEDIVLKLNPGDEIEIISDQQSTIFRFLPENMKDNSYPKKNADWWITHYPHVIRAVSAALILCALVVSFFVWQALYVEIQKPSPLNFESRLWKKVENTIEKYNQPEEIASYASMLTPAVGDMNGDHINDLLFCDKTGFIHALDGKTREVFWKKDFQYRNSFPNQLVLADLNGDDLSDVILPSNNSKIYAIDGGTGYEIWNSALINGEFASSPAVGDLDGNGMADIVYATTEGEFYVGLANYKEPVWVNFSLKSETECVPVIADIDGDKIPEAIIGTNSGEVYIYDAVKNEFEKIINMNEEMQKAKGSYFEDHKISSKISVGDLNGDEINDLVILSESGSILTIAGKTFHRMWYDEIVNTDPFSVNLNMKSAVGDLNNDGKMDVVILTRGNSIVAYQGTEQAGGTGVVMWKFTPESYDNLLVQPVVADMTKDGALDVIIAGINGGVYVLNGMDGEQIWNGTKSVDIDNAFVSVPIIADMDGNKTIDMIIRDANDQFYEFESNAITKKNNLLWSQLYKDGSQNANMNVIVNQTMLYTLFFLACMLVIIGLIIFNYFDYQKRKKLFQTRTV